MTKIAMALLLVALQLRAQVIISPESYSFPNQEPLTAAVSTAYLGVPNGEWFEVKIPNLNREVKGLKKHSRLEFRYLYPKPEKDREEVVYILPGFGGNVKGSKSSFFARTLAHRGFHVIILPSIFSPEFIVSSSREAVVGEFSRDAWDFYLAMKLATEYVMFNFKHNFTKKHLVGYSYGALTAGFVARIDKDLKYFNLDKEILINPPTNLLGATRTLDKYYAQKKLIGFPSYYTSLIKTGVLSLYYKQFIPSIETYQSYLSKLNITQEQAMAMVGASLRSPLPSVAKAVVNSLYHDHGNLRGARPDLKYRFYDFTAYLKKILLPYNRKNHFPGDTLEKMNKRNSIYSLRNYMATHHNLYVVHNLDDFLIQEGDVEFFSETLGDRFVLYPWGGHMGNMWYKQNVNGLVSLIEGFPVWQ